MIRDEAISVLKITSVNLGRRGGRTAYVEALEMAIEALRVQDVPDMNVGDMIYRQAAIDIVVFECGEWAGLAKEISKQLKQLPPAQPERKKGHWVGIDDEPCDDWECDRCGEVVTDCGYDVLPNFCPHCGADMRGIE